MPRPTRRRFIQSAIASTAAATLAAAQEVAQPNTESQPDIAPADAPLKILILGGTGFLGPHQVRYALARGHTVTLFNRGRTNPHLFSDVEKLVGDRNDDLAALEDREFDAVIDNSANIPRWVRQSCAVLNDNVGSYQYVSSISAYASFESPGMDESADVGTLDDPTVERITGTTYGPLKALCEQETRDAFPDSHIIIRPGLIVGPGDPTGRFTYWPVRIDQGGEAIAPGNTTDPVQFIDARDLAQFQIKLAEDSETGTYNVTGPNAALTIAEMLYGIRAITSSDVRFTWVDAEFLTQHNVHGWSHLPVWVSPADGMEGFGSINCQRAIDAGLTCRPLARTASDTLAWFKARPEQHQRLGASLRQEKEEQVLAAWHEREGR